MWPTDHRSLRGLHSRNGNKTSYRSGKMLKTLFPAKQKPLSLNDNPDAG
jgi:hypothetical protein